MGRQPINAGGLARSVGALLTRRVEIRTSAPTTSGTAVTSMGGNRWGMAYHEISDMESAIDAFRVYLGSIPRSAPCSKPAPSVAPSPATLPHAYSRSFSAPVADQPGLARPEHQRANARPAAPMCESRTRLRRPNGVRGLGFSPWPRTAQGGCHGPTPFPPSCCPETKALLRTSLH